MPVSIAGEVSEMSRTTGMWMGLVWGIVFCLVAVAGGLGAGYAVDSGMLEAEKKPVTLSSKFSFKGPVDERYLDFSRDEILILNRSIGKSRTILTGVDLQLGILKKDMVAGQKNTLRYSLEIKAANGGIVKSWPRKATRKSLVSDLKRCLHVAAEEVHRCRKKCVSFRVIYI